MLRDINTISRDVRSEVVQTNEICAWSSVVCGYQKLERVGLCNTLPNVGLLDFVSTSLLLAEVRCWVVCVDNFRHVVITLLTLYLIHSNYSWIGCPV